MRPAAYSHALHAVRRYDARAARVYALAAYCVSVGFIYAAERLQADAAHYAAQARKYRLRLLGAEPEGWR